LDKSTNAVDARQLRRAIIEFYRGEIARRYALENVRRFENFSNVTDDQITELRGYFLEHIYPPADRREVLDDAINRMGEVLRSPRRLRPLMKTVVSSVFRLGFSLPTAIRAGLSTLDAYVEARKLEASMFDAAQRLGLRPEDQDDRARMIRVIASVDEDDVARLINDIMTLFHALSDTRMLATAVEFLERCEEIMKRRPELYPEPETRGIALGRQMVQGGLDLFLALPPEEFPRIIEGIETIEWEWYRAARIAAGREPDA
jgi:hypothetical protein